jgi:hypothetical protein
MKQNNATKLNAHQSTLPKWQQGTALVEFCIVSPLLFLLLFGFTETGRLLYQQNQLTKQVTTGARYIARIPDALNADDCSIGPGWTTAVSNAKKLVTQSINGEPVLPGLDPDDVTFTVIAINVSIPSCVIHAEVETGYITILGNSPTPFLNIGPVVLNTSTEERFLGL